MRLYCLPDFDDGEVFRIVEGLKQIAGETALSGSDIRSHGTQERAQCGSSARFGSELIYARDSHDK